MTALPGRGGTFVTKPDGPVPAVRLVAAALLSLGLLAGEASWAGEERAGPAASIPVEEPIDDEKPSGCYGSPAFGARLLNAVSEGGAHNALVSPLGARIALAMMAQGGTAPVRAAFRELAGAPPICALKAVLGASATDGRIDARIANGAFADPRLDLFPAFSLALRERFDARVEALDFADARAAETIDSWVSEKTDGAISTLVERLDPDDRLVLANAIHFRAEWAHGFDPELTAPAPFRPRSGETVAAPAMRADELPARHRADADFEAVSLPYGDGAFALAAVLPRDGMTPEEALGRLTEDPSWLAGKGFRRARGALQLPRLALDSEAGLLPVLRALGLAAALDDENAFAGIGAPPPELSRLVQRVALEVDERGTTASAATAAVMATRGSIPGRFDLRIDRPFALSIRYVETGALLFVAWVDNPAAG